MISIDPLFKYLSVFFLFINACLYIWGCRIHKCTVALKYFTAYITIICTIQIVAFVYAHFKKNNLYLKHFYFIIQFVVLSLFFGELFTRTQKKVISCILVIIILILGIQYYTTPILFYRFNNLEIFITSIPLIVYSIVHLYNSLNKPPKYMYINIQYN